VFGTCALCLPWLHRLFVPRVQHKHGTFSDGFTRSVALGQGSDDGAGIDFIYDVALLAARAVNIL
jgi:hypothetical protein